MWLARPGLTPQSKEGMSVIENGQANMEVASINLFRQDRPQPPTHEGSSQVSDPEPEKACHHVCDVHREACHVLPGLRSTTSAPCSSSRAPSQ